MTAATEAGLRGILLAALDDAIDFRDGDDPQDAALADDYRAAMETLRAAGDDREMAVLLGGEGGEQE